MSTTEQSKTPVWMALNAEGVVVSLSRAEKINGIEVDKVLMRTPSIRDVRSAAAIHKTDAEAMELMLFTSLCEAGPKDLEGFSVKNYNRLNTAYFRLVEEDGNDAASDANGG